MKRVILLAAIATGLVADASHGIPARNNVRLYRGTTSTDTYDLGVTLLPESTVKQQFSSEIYRGYVVVEVAFFPKDGANVNVSHGDFSLRNKESGQVAYSTIPSNIAGVLQKAASRRTVDVYPEASVGYETGRGTYDGVNGPRRSGVYTASGVGVGVGNPGQRPGASPQDRQVTQMELADKALPEGATTQPVAGYLYFPITSKKRSTPYEVVYRTPQGSVTLSAGQR